jgi:hypothetical protein
MEFAGRTPVSTVIWICVATSRAAADCACSRSLARRTAGEAWADGIKRGTAGAAAVVELMMLGALRWREAKTSG